MKRYRPKKGFKITFTILGFSILLLPLVWIASVAGIVIWAICFLTFGGFEVVYVHPFEDSREYKECVFGNAYNLEDKLRKEQENLALYRKEQSEAWINVATGGALLFAGFLVTLISLFLATILVVPILGVFPGYFIMFMSYHWFWEGFINSSLPLAAKISDEFCIRSTSVKIEETSKKIAALKRSLKQAREKEERLYGSVLE